LLACIPKDCVIACELDQHPGLEITQFWRRPPVPRHVIEQAFGLAEKRERRGARHVVFLGLFYRLVYDLGGELETMFEECLAGLELLPGIDRTGAGCEREHQEYSREHTPKPVPALARSLGATEHFISANADETGNYLGKTEAFAIAAVAQIGTKHRLIGDCAVRREFIAQGSRKVVRRRAVDDNRDHWSIRMARPEKPHLLVDGGSRRRNRRTQHEHCSRSIQCGYRGGGQRGATGEVVAIPEDRSQ